MSPRLCRCKPFVSAPSAGVLSMLASSAVPTAAEPVGGLGLAVAAASAVAAFCALFFSGGFADGPLVWVGGLALGLAAVAAAAAALRLTPAPALDLPTGMFLGCLFGLAVWMGLSTLWSLSPDRTWGYTNRTLVYAAFALLGVLVAAILPRPGETVAHAAAVLLGLVLGWALLAKCVPALYPGYGVQPGLSAALALARLRSPVGYWNELALLADVTVPVALWLAAPRGRRAVVRAAGALLLFAAVIVLLLTYSRFGVALAVAAAAGWIVLDRDRVESLVAAALAAAAGAAAFGVALALPGITKDGQSHAVRVHDGWIFGLGRARARRGRVRGRARACARGGAPPARARESRARRAHRCACRSPRRLRRDRLERGVCRPDLARLRQSRLESDRIEHVTSQQPQLEQPLALVDGGVERLHEPSAQRHRRGHLPAHRPAPASQPADDGGAAQHAAAAPRRDGHRRLSALRRLGGRRGARDRARAPPRVRRRARGRDGARGRARRVPRPHGGGHGLELRRHRRAAPPRGRRGRRAPRAGAGRGAVAASAARARRGAVRARRRLLAGRAVARGAGSSRRPRRSPPTSARTRTTRCRRSLCPAGPRWRTRRGTSARRRSSTARRCPSSRRAAARGGTSAASTTRTERGGRRTTRFNNS